MDSSTVRDPVRRRLALTIERIVQRTPELNNPRYLPTFWAAGMWPNLALLMIKQVIVMMMMMIVMMIMMMMMMRMMLLKLSPHQFASTANSPNRPLAAP